MDEGKTKVEKRTKTEIKVKIVTLGEYIGKVGNTDGLQGIEKRRAALLLLYSENKIIDKIESKGEILFIVEK